MDIGLKAGGLTLQQSFEIETVCCETMRQNFVHEVVQCDITKKLVLTDKDCHVMVATYPSAALVLLMSAIETATEPRTPANTVKHIGLTRCSELNFCGVFDAQIATFESELLRE